MGEPVWYMLMMSRQGLLLRSDWVNLAVQEEVIESNESSLGVADFFYTAPGLDKVKLGIYLSKGPDADYPFQAAVRGHFVSLFDFSDMKFAAALRKFLSKFRLPGEAQCIDRLMEAFSKEYYEQKGKQPQPISTKPAQL